MNDKNRIDSGENEFIQEKNELESAAKEHESSKEAARIKEERENEHRYSETHESYTPDEDKEIPDYYAAPKISIGKILKYVVIGLVILIYGLIFYRMYLQNNSGVEIVSQLIANSETVKAYNNCLDEGESFDVFYQEFTSYSKVLETDENKRPTKTTNIIHHEYSQSKTYYGMFSISNFLYYEDSNQVVITLRYNRNAVKTLKEEYKVSSLPSEPFFFTLDDGKKFYDSYYYLQDKKFTYNYRRLIFDGVTLDDISKLSLNIYYIADCDDYTDTLESMQIYDSNIPMKKVSNTAALGYFTDGLKKKPINLE